MDFSHRVLQEILLGGAVVTVGSLFSGIGGLDLGLEWAGFETKWFCEIEKFPQAVLRKHWPDVPIIEDVRDVTSGNVQRVDVIAGGFPCQDISVARAVSGREGLAGRRSGLWHEMARTIRDVRPRYVIIENVSALINFGLNRVLADLAADGRDASWAVIPASAAGADHRRDRLFIVSWIADDNSLGVQGNSKKPFPWLRALQGQQNGRGVANWPDRSTKVVDPFWRGADGVSTGLYNDRLKGLGNAVVPQVGYLVGRAVRAHAEENGWWI